MFKILTQEQILDQLHNDPSRALVSQLPVCTCYLLYQFYQCGCPDTRCRTALGLWGQPLQFRQPVHLPSRCYCPITRLPRIAQEILHTRGFRHKFEPWVPCSAVPVELPFPCYTHREACTYRITKKELERRRCYLQTAAGVPSGGGIGKIKRREKVRRKVAWAERHKKALREFWEENALVLRFGALKVIHQDDEKFIERWDKIVEPPLHVRLENERWFEEEQEQEQDLRKDDVANGGSRVADRMFPEIGLLGRDEYELGAAVLDLAMVLAIAKDQWKRRGYPWENVQRLGNSGAEVFHVWSME